MTLEYGEVDVQRARNQHLVLSYLELRRAVGGLGVLLPVVLPIGVLFLGSDATFQASISDYHGTVMRGVFVGVLFATGVFLFSYSGHEPVQGMKAYQPSDNFAGNMACMFAIGVALFPVTSDVGAVRVMHFFFATGLFLTLSYFALHLFTKTDGVMTAMKRTRNKVYRVCGIVMLACIVSIAIYNWFLQDTIIAKAEPVFWLEAAALWAFGWAWFVKGEGLRRLNDEAKASELD
jgi:hypothetical protein